MIDRIPTKPRGALMFLAIWCLLQLPRLIAIPLIMGVVNGDEDPAWMYPAVLDIVVAVAAIPVAYLLWFRRGLLPFVAGVVFFAISIVDHGDALTATWLSPTPQIFGGEGAPPLSHFTPGFQAIIDVVAIWVLCSRRLREWFGVAPTSNDVPAAKVSSGASH